MSVSGSEAVAPNVSPARRMEVADRAIARTSGLRVALAIWHREMVRFRRQPSRIGAAVGTPLLIWAFMGSGFSRVSLAPSASGQTIDYAAYLLPGMMTLVAMFTAIFSAISIIDDRREGWLQSVLVSPAPRWSIAAGKMLGGSSVAFVQAAVLLLGLPVLGVWPGWGNVGLILIALALTSLAMTGVGVAFAWRSETTQGFHAVMNLVLMPMWLLSGAFFPPSGAATWLAWIMLVNPLTWCTYAIREPLFAHARPWPFVAAGLFALVGFGAATAMVARRRKGEG